MVIREEYDISNRKVYMGEGSDSKGNHTVVLLRLRYVYSLEVTIYGCMLGW